jgi:hypothetical protein
MASALDVAVRISGADAIVVAPGPGGIGTSTDRGFGALDVATVIDTTVHRGGLPIVALRVSDVDPRPRHRGLSHHSVAALEHTHATATVAFPAGEAVPDLPGTHRAVAVALPDVAALLAAAGPHVATMGRTPADDPRPFAYAAAAGALAGASLRSSA